MPKKKGEEIKYQEIWCRLPYRWATGRFIGEWYREIKENGKIYANKCPKCGRFHCPPQMMCGKCHVHMEEREKWVEVGPGGRLVSFGIVEQSFLYPDTGEMLPVPFTIGFVEFDGAPKLLFTHYIAETNPDKMAVGMRAEAVFKPKDQRQGNIFDIVHFKLIDKQGAEGR